MISKSFGTSSSSFKYSYKEGVLKQKKNKINWVPWTIFLLCQV